MNGIEATITVAQEFIYPTGYQQANVGGGEVEAVGLAG